MADNTAKNVSSKKKKITVKKAGTGKRPPKVSKQKLNIKSVKQAVRAVSKKQTSQKKKNTKTAVKQQTKKQSKQKISKKQNTLSKKIILLIILLLVLGVLCFLYGYNIHYYSDYFYNGTIINQIDCSDMSLAEAKDTLQDKVETYTLTLSERDGATETITADKLNLTYEDDGTLEQLLADQHPVLWLFNMNKPGNYSVEAGFTYDPDALQTTVDSLACISGSIAPADAYIATDEKGYMSIVPEVMGNQINREVLVEKIGEAADAGMETLNLEEAGCYLTPTVFSDNADLVAQVERNNQIVAMTSTVVNVALPDGKTSVIDSSLLNEWLTEDENGNPTISQDALKTWVDSLAAAYPANSKGGLFKTTSGEILQLTKGTCYGWEIDADKTFDAIWEALTAGGTSNVTPVLSRTDDNGNDTSGTYVEICISKQEMWLYVDHVAVVDTPVVSGNLSIEGRATPTGGIWKIDGKYSPYHMKGKQLEDGSYEYECDVDYWLPFNDDVGIHDLSSRTSFGGTIYKYAGSHGCINTPYEAVKQIYSLVSVGTPVIVYD